MLVSFVLCGCYQTKNIPEDEYLYAGIQEIAYGYRWGEKKKRDKDKDSTGVITAVADAYDAVESVLKRFGRIDILVNNAGTGAIGNAEDISDEQFMHEVNVDLFGTFICAREFGRAMLDAGYGRIINIASFDYAVLHDTSHSAGIIVCVTALKAEDLCNAVL